MDFFAEATSAVVDASSTIIVTTQPTDIHSMPNEVLVKILQYVVVTENNIVVTQVCDRSNKVSSFPHSFFNLQILIYYASFFTENIRLLMTPPQAFDDTSQQILN